MAFLCASLHAGVRPPGAKEFDEQQSAALFVGVHTFDDRALPQVKYAIDDAVDLAYELAIEHEPLLVTPRSVVLALSDGEPFKKASRHKLEALLQAGAVRCPARSAEILGRLEALAGRVGRNGILIVSVATHGASDRGAQQLLATDGPVTEKQLRDAAWNHDVRALFFFDACRGRRGGEGRGAGADAHTRTRFGRVMMGIDGQAVFSAAAMGGYAYDDDARGNGVFTATVIDGLRCGAAKDFHHFVTVETLYRYVAREVRRWVRKHQKPRARPAELTCESETLKMPLTICGITRSASARRPRRR